MSANHHYHQASLSVVNKTCVVPCRAITCSPSCFGLRHLVSICEHSGSYWDIKFNPVKSQLMTFGGSNPNVNINMIMNSSTIPWINKVKYLGVYFLSNTAKTDLTDTTRRFYGQLNNIMSVLGKGSHEMNAVYLLKRYCLPTIT